VGRVRRVEGLWGGQRGGVGWPCMAASLGSVAPSREIRRNIRGEIWGRLGAKFWGKFWGNLGERWEGHVRALCKKVPALDSHAQPLPLPLPLRPPGEGLKIPHRDF